MISRRLLRIKVIKALYAHLKSESDSLAASEKNLVASIDKTYDLYFHLLSLITEVARYAEERQETAKRKKLPTFEDLNPNRKFVDNAVVALLERSDYYKKYMASSEHSFREDLSLVVDFYSNELEESEMLEDVLDEESILWNDDLGFVLAMVIRTLSGIRQSHRDVKVMPEFKNPDDLLFAKELFAKAALNFDAHLQYIEKFTRNWDVERIAFMDNLIMVTAMTELISFPSIPVKVTLDEYIEIAKYYSTPASSTFINGVLDKIVSSLTEEGRINKSGRGLI